MQTNPAVKQSKSLDGPWVRGISPVRKRGLWGKDLLKSQCLEFRMKYWAPKHVRCLSSRARISVYHCQSLASCLIYGQPFRHTSSPRPTPISLTAFAHFGARLGAFFYWTGCFENNVPFDNTAQIYLINLHWKLGLGFKLRLRVELF